MSAVTSDGNRKCPVCAEEIKAEAVKCRFCGEQVGGAGGGNNNTSAQAQTDKASKMIMWVVGAPLAVIVGMMLIGGLQSPASKEEQGKKLAIKLCWEQLERVHDIGAMGLAQSTCEMMEQQYQQKYGRAP